VQAQTGPWSPGTVTSSGRTVQNLTGKQKGKFVRAGGRFGTETRLLCGRKLTNADSQYTPGAVPQAGMLRPFRAKKVLVPDVTFAQPESQFRLHTQVRNRKSGFTPQPGIAAQASHPEPWKPHSP
jgi:hypothetical protein